ncbi:hypothetical protein OROGR_005191 [Orobanche gracilis]
MAPKSKLPEKHYASSSSKRARKSSYDDARFVSATASKVFLEILPQEQLTDCYYFNLNSLERAHLDITEFFEDLSLVKFISCKEPIYPNLVREFYANLHVIESDIFSSYILGSKVGGVDITVSAEILFELFDLSNKGYSCQAENHEEETRLNDMDVTDYLKENAVIEVLDGNFEVNDFGINIRMVLVALTKCLMPKVNTQHKLVGIDKNVVYHVLANDAISFGEIVVNWMKVKSELFRTKNYDSRSRKAGMPFGSILTVIFRHFNVDLSKETSISVSRGHEISESSLRAMNYVETLNRGWVLFPYLREDDQVPPGTRIPTEAERITERGPTNLRELQESLVARRRKAKGKKKVPEKAEKEIVARMRGLETSHQELRQEITSLRTEMRDGLNGIRSVLHDFIRSNNPSFPLPETHSHPNP